MMTTPLVHLIYPMSKRKMEEEELDTPATASSRHSTPSSRRGDAPQGADTFKLLLVVDRMEEVPVLVTLM